MKRATHGGGPEQLTKITYPPQICVRNENVGLPEKSEISHFVTVFTWGDEEQTRSKMKKKKQGMTPDGAPGLSVG